MYDCNMLTKCYGLGNSITAQEGPWPDTLSLNLVTALIKSHVSLCSHVHIYCTNINVFLG
jgi:hypothetical protein